MRRFPFPGRRGSNDASRARSVGTGNASIQYAAVTKLLEVNPRPIRDLVTPPSPSQSPPECARTETAPMIDPAQCSRDKRMPAPPRRLIETAVWAQTADGDTMATSTLGQKKRRRAPLQPLSNAETEYSQHQPPVHRPPPAAERVPSPPNDRPSIVDLSRWPWSMSFKEVYAQLQTAARSRPCHTSSELDGEWAWSRQLCFDQIRIDSLLAETAHRPPIPSKTQAALAPPIYSRLLLLQDPSEEVDKEAKPPERKRRAHTSVSRTEFAPKPMAASDAACEAPQGKSRAPVNGAQSASEVTHAFTLKGAQLTLAVLSGIKRVENRHFQMKPGWYAVQTGASTRSHESQYPLLDAIPGMPAEEDLPHSAIVGAVRITHALSLEQCAGEEWAFGPVVNVIGAVCRLREPVPHRGALSLWRIRDDVLDDVQAQLADATIFDNHTSHLPPPNEAPATFNIRASAKAQGYAASCPPEPMVPPPHISHMESIES